METADEIVKLLLTIDNRNDIDKLNLTPIQAFYNDTNVFITGSMGFLGQLLLEKLLRSCPVSKIYLLSRSKKGKDMETRLEEMLNDPVFQRIKNQEPRTRLVPIEGDCSLPDLGLSDQAKEMLIREVDVVFHVAATVRFDENIRTAVLTNIRATRDLLRLARRMPRLKSFMHVSTAYANCNHKVIEEDVYPPIIDYEGMIAMVETLPDSILEKVTPRLLEGYPNTYVYTKQIAEDVIQKEGRGLPVGIHRPSIVISTYREPIRGWINNLYGVTGFMFGAGIGFLRILQCDSDCNGNLVPADMCVNSMVAATWDVAEDFKRTDEERSSYKTPVYNYESSNDKPLTWDMCMELTQTVGLLNPSTHGIWYYSLTLTKYYYVYLILRFFLHTVPAYIVDGVRFCAGKPPMMIKAYQKIHKFTGVLKFFCNNDWKFNSKNVQKVVGNMSERDRAIFFSDLKELDWEEFFKCYTIGTRTYFLKESLDTLPAARKKYKRLYWMHQTLKITTGILLIWAVCSLISFCFRLVFH